MRSVMRLNDPIIHGGKVISAALIRFAQGEAAASKRDRCLCLSDELLMESR